MTHNMVDASPARKHVQDLVARGMRQQSIAEAAPVTMAALSLLLHGHFTPGRPPQQTINAISAQALLAVKFEPRGPRTRNTELRCPPSPEFEPAGYKVGRCLHCGELTWLWTRGDDCAPLLIAHPTLDPLAGDDEP